MSAELIHALEQLEKEKGINKEVLIEAIEAALISAFKRNFNSMQNVKISFDNLTGDIKVFALRKVVADRSGDPSEISLEESREIDKKLEEGDVLEIEVTPKKFGRIAAQTAKQVVVQRIREAERGIIFDEYYSKESEIVTGIIQRAERKNVIIDLGKTEAVLPATEQTPGEEYKFNYRIKTYVIEVKKTTKGPQITLSRTHPGLVKRLFELEVPEIHDGTVEIKSIAREPGSRTKMAVFTKDENVDPVGACVGQKGTRVQAVVDELKGEKIDIIEWDNNPEAFISSSLNPAKVVRVDINEQNKSARVIVPDYQLSLAIGKEGQNARLAAKLTGWRIDIKSESQLRASIEQGLLNFDRNYQDDGFENRYVTDNGNEVYADENFSEADEEFTEDKSEEENEVLTEGDPEEGNEESTEVNSEEKNQD